MRRTLALALLAGLAGAAHAQEEGGQTAVARADATLAATRRFFAAQDGTSLYRELYPGRGAREGHATEWPFSQVHIGVLDLAGAPGADAERHRAALAAHRAAQMLYWTKRSATGLPGFESMVTAPVGRGGPLYYDDNEWVGLAAIQHWQAFHDPESLKLAEQIFALVRAAWDSDPHHPAPGGLFWTQARDNRDRNTVSNMPAAEIGVRLYQATGDHAYLDDALRYYDWTNRNLQRPDGLYVDHIDLKGKIDGRVFSYNQGVPIGVDVLLYKATGEDRYLTEAKRIAEASFAHFVAGDRLDTQQVAFNAIYFKNLLLLESVVGGTRFHDAMRDYSAHMWRDRRDPETGLFRPAGRHRDAFKLIDQGAMIQIDAVLGWDPANYPLLY